MARRSHRWPNVLVAIVIAGGLGGMVALIVYGSRPGSIKPIVETEPAPVITVSQRLRVAGADGFWIIINPDGTSYLEGPSGRRELVDKTFASMPTPQELADRVAKRLKPGTAPKTDVGQLIVLDAGVVDVPPGALITYTGTDRLVVLNDDGTSTVYYADGHTEVRDRDKPYDRPRPVPTTRPAPQ